MNNTAETLESTVSSNIDKLLDTVLASEDLPTLPAVASKLVTLTSSEETTLSDVADLVSQDVALSSSILKVANSAFYGFPQQIGTIAQAVSMLGTKAVQSLVLSFSFLSMNKRPSSEQFDFDKFWERSLASAGAAKLILEKIPGVDTEEIFVAALLQNLGQLILVSTMPEEYEKVMHEVAENDVDVLAAEKAVFGADHCLIGYEVAKHWGFPTSMSLPILHHHDPASYAGNDSKIKFSTRAIYLSDLLLNIFYSETPEEYYCQFQTEAAELLNLDSRSIEAIMQDSHTELDQVAVNFGFKAAETRPVQEILQEANIRLSVLNLDYEQVNKELVKAKVALEKLTSELQEKNKHLKSLADMDGLTGIYNNRYFQGALDKELSRTLRKQYHLSLVMVDVDHFKGFNDDYGHLVGDFVLTEISRVMKENVREYDTLARYGGEEFVLVLPETGEQDAYCVAEKIRSAVERAAMKENGKTYRVTASFGLACIQGEEGMPGKTELIKRADEALYEAKKKGRNQVAVYAEKKKWFKKG